MKRFITACLTLFATIGLVACTSSSEANKIAEESPEISLDNYGRQLTVTQVPQKVLTIGPNATELFVALGLENVIIGNALDNHSRGPLPEYKEAYDKIPELTYGSPTREAVLSSGADFIYGIDWEFGKEGLDIDELRTYGISTYLNSASTIEEAFQEIADIGRIFAIEDRAKDFIDSEQSRLAKVKESLPSSVTVLVYDSGQNGVFTASQSNFESRLIEAAGGQNIFSDLTSKDWITVSKEEVFARHPEVIIIHDYDAQTADEKIAELKSDPVLGQLEAVKNEQFVVISLESALPGPRIATTVETLAKAFQNVGERK